MKDRPKQHVDVLEGMEEVVTKAYMSIIQDDLQELELIFEYLAFQVKLANVPAKPKGNHEEVKKRVGDINYALQEPGPSETCGHAVHSRPGGQIPSLQVLARDRALALSRAIADSHLRLPHRTGDSHQQYSRRVDG